MECVLGIDQGGSKTLAAIADLDGNILGLGRAEGAQHSVTGLAYAIRQAALAAQGAARAAGISCGPFLAVAAGMSGADFDYEYELLRKALSEEFRCENVRVVNDCIIALRGGTWEKDAVIICAGTGLNCAVCTEEGGRFVFGYYIDDRWQGGCSIANRALMSVFEAHVGLRGKTALTGEALLHFGVNDVDTLLQKRVRGELGKSKTNQLAEVVDRCAAEGDCESRHILEEFGHACAWYALTGLRRAGLLDKPVAVVLSGSIFKSRGLLPRETIGKEILAKAPLARMMDARYEPVVGGVLMALEEAGVTAVDRGIIELGAVRCGAIRQLTHLGGEEIYAKEREEKL